jgi:hypothetical protein
MTKRKKSDSTPLLDSLDLSGRSTVLYNIIREYPDVRAYAEEIAEGLLCDVDIDDIAESLADELDCLKVEEVWDSSGRTRDGYVDPGERAYEMLEEITDEYVMEMNKYMKRGMPDQSRDYCAGILYGLYKFEKDYHSDVLEETPDFCHDQFSWIRKEWEKKIGDERQIKLLAEILEEKGLCEW